MNYKLLKKKRIQAAVVVAIAALLVIVGTFAWNSFTQQKINVFNTVNVPNVNLHDDFAGGPEKDVYVENSGQHPVLVRVRFTELLRMGDELFPDGAIDDGEGTDWHQHIPTRNICEACDFKAHEYYTWIMNGQKFYMPAPGSAKGVLTDDTYVEPMAVGDLDKIIDYAALLRTAFADDQLLLSYIDEYLGGDASHAEDLQAEIAKIPDSHTVSNVRQYDGQPENELTRRLNEVRLTLIPDQIITMQDWKDGETYGEPYKSGDFWVMDTDGWCYWANALNSGDATGQLLADVNNAKTYSGDLIYRVNVMLNATTFADTKLGEFFALAVQNGSGITEDAMFMMLMSGGNYVLGADGELYINDGDGFYRKVNKDGDSYLNYTLGETFHVRPGSLPGDDGGLSAGSQFGLDENGKMTNGDDYQIATVVQGNNGVVYLDVGGGVFLTPTDEYGNPDNNGEQYAIMHPGVDGRPGTGTDIGPIRAEENYPQWYFVNITDVTDDDVIEAGQKGSLVRANNAVDVPAQTFGVVQSVYRVQAITRGVNGLLYLKLGDGLYAVALNIAGEPVNLTMTEALIDGEPERVPEVYYIVYSGGESGEIGTDKDTTDITLTISEQPATVSGVYDGTAKTLSVAASGAGTHTYQWYKDGEAINDAVSKTLEVIDVADSGNYYCRITADVNGHSSASIDTDTATVSITARPITIKAKDAEKVYDGTALINNGYTLTGSVADGDELSVTISGSITAVGTTANVASDAKIMRGTTDVTANYDISYTNGTLTVSEKSMSGMTINVTSSHTYNGLAQTPTFTVTDGGTELTEGTDFTAVISNNKNAGSALITINGKGNYSEQKTQSFTIEKAALTVTANNQSATYRDAVPTYGGVSYSGFVNSETATVLGGTLSYTCAYTATSSVGSYDIMPSGLTSTNYTITFAKGTLSVGAKALTNAMLNVTGSYTYSGVQIKPTFTATDVTTINAADYDVSYGANINAGTNVGSITITGKGNYSGTAVQNFTIGAKPLTNAMLTVTGTYTYTGLAQTPTVTVNDGSALTSGIHYNNVNATNNINAGTTASVSVTGIGNYSGTVSKSFTIAQKALTITANSQSVTYRDAVPAYGVTYSGFVNGQTASALGGTLAYDCLYTTTSNAGSYAITPKGQTSSNYAISFANGTLTVNAKSLSGATVINVTGTYTYNGSAQTPTFTVTDGGVPLTSGTNYTASYANNTNAHATAPTVTITGTGNYTGTAAKNFTISPKPLNASMLTVTGSYTYTGLAQTPTVTVTDGSALTNGTHYNNVNATNNTNAGTTASVSVTGINNYTGTVSKNFTIAQKSLTVTATNKSVIYGDTAPANSVAYSGFVNGEDASKLGGTLAYDCLYTTTSNVGSFTITPKGQTSSNYAISFANGTLTVNKRPITIAALSTSKEYDGNALTYYVYGISSGSLASGEDFSGVTYSGVITDVGSVSNAITGYTILRSGNNVTANYNVSTISGTLTITSPFSGGGAGTSGSPFLIANKADLEKLRDKVNSGNTYEGKYFQQTENINLNNESWAPIGISSPFRGIYDGGGNKISGLYMNDPSANCGLFGITMGATVKNLFVEGNITATTNAASSYVGGIVGWFTVGGVMENCVFSGTITAESAASVGGLIGSFYHSTPTTVKNCYVTYGSEIKGGKQAGGLVGSTIAGVTVNSSYSLAKVTGTINVGGIAGSSAGTITNCAFIKTGALNDSLNVVGSNSGTVTSSGGVPVVGSGLLTLLNTDQASTPWIQTNAGVSWPVLAAINREHDGWDGNEAATFEHDSETKIVTITAPGEMFLIAKLLNDSRYNETMNKQTYILGANIDLNGISWTPLGANSTTAAFATTFDGDGYTISGLNVNSTNYAGLFGFLSNATVKNLSVKGNISSSTANFVGGIAGISRDASTISNCVFSGSIAGSSYVGGIVGAAMNGETIEYCYVADGSKVTNTAVSLGGIAGAIQYGTQVKSCYSLAQVSGSNYVGGVVGAFAYDETDRVSRCAFLKTGTINSSLYAVGSDTYANTINFTGYFASANGSLTPSGSPDVNSTGTMPANLLALLNGDGQNKYRADSGGVNSGYPVLNVIK